MNSFSSPESMSSSSSSPSSDYSSRSRNRSGDSSSSSYSFLEDDDQYQKVVSQLVLSITEEAPLLKSPKHLKLLFGTGTEKRISGMTALNFNGALAESDLLDTAVLSYYDFQPEEERMLLSVVDRRATTHLTVAINDYEDHLLLDSIRRLITELALVDAPLTSLQLYINWSRSKSFRLCTVHAFSLFRLLDSLNCLPRLRRLTVIVDHCVFSTIPADNVNCQVDLSPLLSRLQEFNFSTGDELQSTPVFRWLEMAATATEGETPSLQTIRLGNPDLRHQLTDFTDRFPALGRAIVDLPRIFWSNPSPFVSRSLACLPHLTHLSLRVHCTAHLMGLLYAAGTGTGQFGGGLTALQSMSIILNTFSPATGHMPLSAFDHHRLYPTAFPALQSLKLVANVRSHQDLHSPLWSVVFPQLEHLDLTHNCVSCTTCPQRPGRLTTKARAKVAKLFEEHLFLPFKQCAQLSSVNVKKDGGKWAQSYVLTKVNGWKVPLKVGPSSSSCARSGRSSRSSSSSSSSSSYSQ